MENSFSHNRLNSPWYGTTALQPWHGTTALQPSVFLSVMHELPVINIWLIPAKTSTKVSVILLSNKHYVPNSFGLWTLKTWMSTVLSVVWVVFPRQLVCFPPVKAGGNCFNANSVRFVTEPPDRWSDHKNFSFWVNRSPVDGWDPCCCIKLVVPSNGASSLVKRNFEAWLQFHSYLPSIWH